MIGVCLDGVGPFISQRLQSPSPWAKETRCETSVSQHSGLPLTRQTGQTSPWPGSSLLFSPADVSLIHPSLYDSVSSLKDQLIDLLEKLITCSAKYLP